MRLEVSKPTKNDIGGILKLVNSDPVHLLKRSRNEVARKLRYWRVVKDGDKIIGCGCLDVYSRRIAEIRSFIVHPDYRGHNISKDILTNLLTLVREKQRVFVVTSARDYFEKNGFTTFSDEKYVLFYTEKNSLGDHRR
jgi:N-acetylglutamate synthase-like GNAT family acetyltransferase